MLTIKITGFTTLEQIDAAYQLIYKTYGKEDLAVQSEDDTAITITYGDDNDWDLQEQEVADLCGLDVVRVTTEFVPYTMTLEERLVEYKQLMEEIHTNYQWGRGFVQAALIAVTTCQDSKTRNDYITCMGNKFSIPQDKVERVIALLPA